MFLAETSKTSLQSMLFRSSRFMFQPYNNLTNQIKKKLEKAPRSGCCTIFMKLCNLFSHFSQQAVEAFSLGLKGNMNFGNFIYSIGSFQEEWNKILSPTNKKSITKFLHLFCIYMYTNLVAKLSTTQLNDIIKTSLNQPSFSKRQFKCSKLHN